MKTKVKTLPYEQVLALPRPKPKAPRRPSWLLGAAIRLISAGELRSVGFSATYRDMEKNWSQGTGADSDESLLLFGPADCQ